MADSKLKFSLEVDDKGSVKIKKFGKTVDNVGLKGGSFGAKMKLAAGGVVGLAAGAVKAAAKIAAMGIAMGAALAAFTVKKSVEEFAEFELAASRMGNVTEQSIDEIKKAIIDLPSNLGRSADLMKGYYQVMSAGVTEPRKAMDLLTVASKTSQEQQIETGDVVKGLAALMSAYGDELGSASEAADLLFTIEKKGIVQVGEMIPLLGTLANASKATGLGADEMAAALAQVSAAGQGTAMAVTQLQSFIAALSKKFSQLPQTVQKYGSSLKAVEAIGFDGVMKEIWKATEGNSTALIKMLGRQEGYMALLQLQKSGFGEYTQKLEEMKEKTGAFDDAWMRFDATLKSVWETFKVTVGKQLIMIGEQLAPTIKEVVELVEEWFIANRDLVTGEFQEWIGYAIDNAKELWPAIKEVVIWVKEFYQSAKLFVQSDFVKYLGWIYEALILLPKAFSALTGPFTWILNKLTATKNKADDLKTSINGVKKAADNLDNTKINVAFTGTGSSEQPITEKMTGISTDMKSLRTLIELPTTQKIEMLAKVGPLEVPAPAGFQMVENEYGDMKTVMESDINISVNTDGASASVRALKEQMQTDLAAIFDLGLGANVRTNTQQYYNRTIGSATRAEVKSFAVGTGPAGLQKDGLYYGHKGEIVKNKSESQAERRTGNGNTYNITFESLMASDADMRRAGTKLTRILKNNESRTGGING